MLKWRPSTLQNRKINDECAIIGIVGKICVKYRYFSYEIEKKVDKLEVVEQEGGESGVSGTFVNIQLSGDEGQDPVTLDSSTVITTENIINYIKKLFMFY